MRDVSGIADGKNIVPGSCSVKSGLQVAAQLGKAMQALGMVEIDDQQTSPLVDSAGSRKAGETVLTRPMQQTGAVQQRRHVVKSRARLTQPGIPGQELVPHPSRTGQS